MVTVPLALIVAGLGTALGAPVVGAVLGVLLAAVWALAAWWLGPALVLRSLDTHPADAGQHARLHNLVGGLATAAGVPAPRLLVVDTDAPNALAIGAHPRRATLAAPSGLLDQPA